MKRWKAHWLVIAISMVLMTMQGRTQITTGRGFPPTSSEKPRVPEWISNFRPAYEVVATLPGQASTIALTNTLILLGEDDGLSVVDGADPRNPVRLSHLDLAMQIQDLIVDGPYVYLASSEGLTVVDIDDVEHPTVAGSLAMPINRGRLARVDSSLLLIDRDHGLRIVDSSDPAALREHTRYDPYPDEIIVDIESSQHLAYLAIQNHGLQILDITNPMSPTVMGTYQSPNPLEPLNPSAMAYLDGTIYLAANQGFWLSVFEIDVGDPAHPHYRNSGMISQSAFINDIAVGNPFIAVVRATTLITTLDQRAYGSLIKRLHYDESFQVRLAAMGDLLYLPSYDYGLRIIRYYPEGRLIYAPLLRN